MKQVTFSLVICAINLLAVSGESAGQPAPAAGEGRKRLVHVTVTDRNGATVEGLTAPDFVVKEGGKVREVISARGATLPMQVAIIVDDNGTGIFRSGLMRFVERLDGHAEFALSSVVGQTFKLVDYTTNVAAVQRALASLNARPGAPDGGQLLEGIYEAARELKRREAPRAVIVALTVGGEEHSSVQAHDVLEELRQSGASLHVFSVASSALRTTRQVTKPSALLEENLNLNEVLGDGPRQSGGRRDEIVATTGILLTLQRLASELRSEYAVEYLLPAGVRPDPRLAVTVTRRDLAVRAPAKIPNR
jgi:VWFA-related protein